MTVAQLIDKLRSLDPDRELWVRIPDGVDYAADFPLLDAVTDEESPAAFLVGYAPTDDELGVDADAIAGDEFDPKEDGARCDVCGVNIEINPCICGPAGPKLDGVWTGDNGRS